MGYANKPTDVFRPIDMSAGPDACWPFKGKTNSKNRPYFTVAGTKHLAYRLAYELMYGAGKLDGVIARHTCDNEICCNPRHIVPGDHQQNMDDMKQRERHGLPHHTVRAIRKLGSTPNGPTHQDIADLYGIGRSTVTEIIGGVNYGHVKEQDDVQSDQT